MSGLLARYTLAQNAPNSSEPPEVVRPGAPGEPPPPLPPPAPKPTPAHDKQWECKIQPRAEGEITVGTKLMMICEGPPVKLGGELKIEPREEQKYSLRLVNVKSIGETKAELVVTSWTVGEVKVENPALTDGTTRVGLGNQEFIVVSVIEPEENPEGKPYPPWAPMTLPWPIWIWLVVAAVAAVISMGLWLAVRRSMKRKRLLTTLEKHATALSPFNHFNKELRKLVRQVPVKGEWTDAESRTFFKELDTAFRWFLARELVVDSIDTSPNAVVNEIKRSHRRIWDLLKKELRVAMQELAQAQNVKAPTEDAVQLAELCRTLSDKIVKERGV